MKSTASLYNDYSTAMQQIADVKYASAVLQWDQETYLPAQGSHFRGQQIATLTAIAHERFTSKSLEDILLELSARSELNPEQARNVSLSLYDVEKNKKLPPAFVRQLSEGVNKSFHAWIEARRVNNFDVFAQPLERVVELKRQEAVFLGGSTDPYSTLMNDYDRGLNVATVDALFGSLRPALTGLLQQIQERPQVDDRCLHQHCAKDQQWKLGMEMLRRIGFNFEAGRQDISEHPFTINFSSQDVRVTTRIDEQDFANMLWSCIHEGGHALYEQGLPAAQYGLPLGEYCSLSIHESQSRLWENNIGRSLPFWEANFSMLAGYFPAQFSAVSLRAFYQAINKVQPSLIRTEADEITYHFHVMLRYELEKQLIEGSLQVKDIPDAWQQLYRQYLGVDVPDHKQGCLQDVHWSHGSFGYFATYSIGSLYAAQFDAAIQLQNASVYDEVRMGNLSGIHHWLRQHIYPFGRYHSSGELCNLATGEPLNAQHFVQYATQKYTEIYDIK